MELYQELLSYEIRGLTESISERICSHYTLNSLADSFIADKYKLLFDLMDIEGVTEGLAEKILYFIGMNLVELGDTNFEELSDSGTTRLLSYV
jgi:hypothetical protein